MEINHQQNNRKPMSEWVNRLDYSQRQLVIQMYSNGVSISAITRIYQVHHSSVRYHLRKAGVYIKYKSSDVDMREIERKNEGSHLDFYNNKGEKIQVIRTPGRLQHIGWPEHERSFPKDYKAYVQREKDRSSILLKNGIPNVTVKLPDPDNDTDVFWKGRRKRSPYITESRKRFKIEDTSNLGVEGTVTE